MTLTDVLKQEAEAMYSVTEKMMKLVEGGDLNWKPATGKNWMTVGQLLMHLTNSCGMGIKGFVSGDWGLPSGVQMDDLPPDQMLPPAEKMPTVSSVDEALKLMAEDKKTAFHFMAEAGEGNLLSRKSSAPWGGPEQTLFQHIYTMITHLGLHKAQLFYYLKLQGKNVDTGTLWGM